jgi:hypothetical protein
MSQIECLCGGIAVQIEGDPQVQFFCHCDDCQRVHGAAYVPVAMYPAAAVKVTRGQPSSWALKSTPRTTCADCGTRLFAEIPQIGMRCVMASLLPSGAFKPAFHMQCRYAVAPIRDDLPHFAGLPNNFGGSDETMPW